MTDAERNALRREGALWMLDQARTATHIHGRTIERLERQAHRQYPDPTAYPVAPEGR